MATPVSENSFETDYLLTLCALLLLPVPVNADTVQTTVYIWGINPGWPFEVFEENCVMKLTSECTVYCRCC
jgi:hypothetical protein